MKKLRKSLPTTQEELKQRREKALTLVKKEIFTFFWCERCTNSGLNFGVDIKLMRDIIEDVNKIYGLDHKQVNSLGDDVKRKIMSAAAIQGSQFVGRKVSSIMKVVIKDVAKRAAAKANKMVPSDWSSCNQLLYE